MDEEINFSWYYRSDNDPMKINKVNAEWTRYIINDEIRVLTRITYMLKKKIILHLKLKKLHHRLWQKCSKTKTKFV